MPVWKVRRGQHTVFYFATHYDFYQKKMDGIRSDMVLDTVG
jgi:hypothetical protein